MIVWDYRVFKEDNGDYIIREVFYDGKGCIVGCTKDAVEPFGTSLQNLAEQIEAFKKALTLPVLTLEDVPIRQKEKKRQPNGRTVLHKQVMAELGIISNP